MLSHVTETSSLDKFACWNNLGVSGTQDSKKPLLNVDSAHLKCLHKGRWGQSAPGTPAPKTIVERALQKHVCLFLRTSLRGFYKVGPRVKEVK